MDPLVLISDSLHPPSGLTARRFDHWSELGIFGISPKHSGHWICVFWTVPPFFSDTLLRNTRVIQVGFFGPYLQILLAGYSDHSGHWMNFLWTVLHIYSCVFPLFLYSSSSGSLYSDLGTYLLFVIGEELPALLFSFLSSLHLYNSTCYLFCKFTK